MSLSGLLCLLPLVPQRATNEPVDAFAPFFGLVAFGCTCRISTNSSGDGPWVKVAAPVEEAVGEAAADDEAEADALAVAPPAPPAAAPPLLFSEQAARPPRLVG